MNSPDRLQVAVDIGGTFTDVVARRGDEVTATKVLTSYDDLPDSVIRGLGHVVEQMGLATSDVDVVYHATTIATNALLERRGARVGLLTTDGFGDTLELGRGRRSDPYAVTPQRVDPLVPRTLIEEIPERVDARGQVLMELDEAAVRAAGHRLRLAGVEAIAVAFLHSYLNPTHERRARELLSESCEGVEVILLSSEVLPETREYERTSTTAIAAYLAPVVRRYLHDLGGRLADVAAPRRYWVMQSNGGLVGNDAAGRHPEELVESGPAAGVIGTANLLQELDESRVISFDMGGTTAKAALIVNFEAGINHEYEVGGASHAGDFLHKGTGMPLRVPVVDLDEVGTGGGSLAWIDAAGALRVGPQSATSTPGPACYGLGGQLPTVTDADVVLGYLGASRSAGGIGELDVRAAHDTVERVVAGPLGCDVLTAARGIFDLAVAQMADVVRSVSVAKGQDPRSCALVAFGGAGPLHACAIAARLGISRVYVPALPGVHSALGLLIAGFRVDLSRALRVTLDESADLAPIRQVVTDLTEQVRELLLQQGHSRTAISTTAIADMRYVGQTYEIRVPIPELGDPATLVKAFHDAHHSEFGHHSDDVACEITTIRLTGQVAAADNAALTAAPTPVAPETRTVHFAGVATDTAVVGRDALDSAGRAGPLIITQPDTSIVVPPSATARRANSNFLRIDLG